MRISPLVLLLFAVIGCGSGKTPAGDPVVNRVGMLLVPIPAGEFQMGSPDIASIAAEDT